MSFSTRGPASQSVASSLWALAETRARRASDDEGDISEILGHLEDGIVHLSSQQNSETVLESTGMDANSRGDADGRA